MFEDMSTSSVGDSSIIPNGTVWNYTSDDRSVITRHSLDGVDLVIICVDAARDAAYVWADPTAVETHNLDKFIDGVDAVRTDSLEDITTKANAIYSGDDYDSRVVMNLDIEPEVYEEILKMAGSQFEGDFDATVAYIIECAMAEANDNQEEASGE